MKRKAFGVRRIPVPEDAGQGWGNTTRRWVPPDWLHEDRRLSDDDAAKHLRTALTSRFGRRHALDYRQILKLLHALKEVMKEIRELRGRPHGPLTFGAAMSVLARHGLQSAIDDLWRWMTRTGVVPTREAFHARFNGRLNHLYLSAGRSGAECDAETTIGVVSDEWAALLRAGVKPDRVSYNIAITGLARARLWDRCWELLADMRGTKVAPGVDTFNTMLASGAPPKSILTEMKSLRVDYNARTCTALISGGVKRGDEPEVIERLFRIFTERRGEGVWSPHHVGQVAAAYAVLGRSGDIDRLVREAADRGCTLEAEPA
eukprot:Hpha_TRINITY_DN24199_c0_g1::TRINITY_DN24199_c0_g1_i1::g.9847::m.9847